MGIHGDLDIALQRRQADVENMIKRNIVRPDLRPYPLLLLSNQQVGAFPVHVIQIGSLTDEPRNPHVGVIPVPKFGSINYVFGVGKVRNLVPKPFP